MTFRSMWFSFVFSRELLKLTVLLEHYPEFIQTDVETWVSGQDEKGSLFCKTGNCVNLAFPPSSRPDLPFFYGWRLAACEWKTGFLPPLQAQTSLPPPSCTHSISPLEAEHYSIAKGKWTCFGTHTSRFWSAKDLWQSEPEQSAASLANGAQWDSLFNSPFQADKKPWWCTVV